MHSYEIKYGEFNGAIVDPVRKANKECELVALEGNNVMLRTRFQLVLLLWVFLSHALLKTTTRSCFSFVLFSVAKIRLTHSLLEKPSLLKAAALLFLYISVDF